MTAMTSTHGAAAGRELERHLGRFIIEPAWYLDSPPPSEEPLPLLVCLHGQGQSGLLMREQLGNRLDGPRHLLHPDGPLPVEVHEDGGRREGHAWYVYTGDQERFLASARHAEDYLLSLIDELVATRPIDARRVILLGYSQGGYLAGIMALRHPERFAGLVTINSRIKSELYGFRGRDACPPVLAIHGKKDRFIPIGAAQDSLGDLEKHGVEVTFRELPGGHRFRGDAAEIAAAWIAEIERRPAPEPSA